jgi:general secretion pathway protein D
MAANTVRGGTLDQAWLHASATALGQAPTGADARSQSDDLLRRARQAMAEGNLETAESLVSRSESMKTDYGLFHMGDTPKKARRDLEKARESQGVKPAGDPFAGRSPLAPGAGAAATPPMGAPAGPMSPPPMPPANPMGAAGSYPTTQTPGAGFAARPIETTLPATAGGNAYAVQAAYNAPADAAGATDPGAARIIPLPSAGADLRVAGSPAGNVPQEIAPVSGTNPNPPAFSFPQGSAAPGVMPVAGAAPKDRVLALVREARGALAAGDVRTAEVLAREADAMGVNDREFGPQDDRAWLVLGEIEKMKRRGGAVPASATAGPPADGRFPGSQALYDPANDSTRNIPASAAVPVVQPVEPIAPGRSDGSLIDQASQAQQLLARQISTEISRLEQQARAMQDTDPAQSQALLQQARVVVEKSALDSTMKEMLIRRVDRELGELNQFVEANRGKIELAQRNREVRDSLDRDAAAKLEMQDKLARLVDEYNELIDQQRWAEAEVLAKRAAEMAPNELVVVQLQAQSKAWRRMINNAEIRGASEEGMWAATASVEGSAAPFNDMQPMQFPRNWNELRAKRGPYGGDTRRRSPKELEIEQKLKTPVSLKFANAPLSQVFEKLGAMTGVPIFLDIRGLAAEGIDSSTPVTIDLSSEISLKSALSLILAPQHLTYVIKDEVLKITSDRMRSEEVYPVTYPVGDLVIPIPNFVPTGRMGLAGALADAQANVATGGLSMAGNFASHAPVTAIANSGTPADASVLGQANFPFNMGGGGGPPATGQQQSVPFGPGGMGGGVQPDFESLIELVTSTIQPETWREAGGTQGEVKAHESTLSLVITQTQAVHEQIEDLLTQLRQLQDLQVTIEVRFIRLRDDFYEQIGIDFDLDIDDNSDSPYQVFGRPYTPDNDADPQNPGNQGAPPYPFTSTAAPGFVKDSNNPARDVQDRDHGKTATVGMSAPGVFSADLDIPFTQSSLATASGALTAIPSFTATSPGGANVGFAILSDLEAYFFITAVQDDNRQNVLQAPKVTMFNGQQAFVSDTAQSPFVISVVPVVGDFAAAQQPVIVVLNEGTSLSVQAVVSNDRRFVRLTMVPFFSQIGEVNTFTFEGSQSTTRSTATANGLGVESDTDNEVVNTSGTTVQLPTFAFQTVTTTVSVPDGGTVLLGGIKRMTEVRRENGVPMLSKLPYLNRLFTNVAIGKASESLMMMVTPRIIIQSEEEAAIGVAP